MSSTMNIYALNGHKVIYNAINGNDCDKEEAEKYLKLNEVYTVLKTVVKSSHTEVYLKEIPNRDFNSVLFDDFQLQRKEENQKHPDWEKWNKKK